MREYYSADDFVSCEAHALAQLKPPLTCTGAVFLLVYHLATFCKHAPVTPCTPTPSLKLQQSWSLLAPYIMRYIWPPCLLQGLMHYAKWWGISAARGARACARCWGWANYDNHFKLRNWKTELLSLNFVGQLLHLLCGALARLSFSSQSLQIALTPSLKLWSAHRVLTFPTFYFFSSFLFVVFGFMLPTFWCCRSQEQWKLEPPMACRRLCAPHWRFNHKAARCDATWSRAILLQALEERWRVRNEDVRGYQTGQRLRQTGKLPVATKSAAATAWWWGKNCCHPTRVLIELLQHDATRWFSSQHWKVVDKRDNNRPVSCGSVLANVKLSHWHHKKKKNSHGPVSTHLDWKHLCFHFSSAWRRLHHRAVCSSSFRRPCNISEISCDPGGRTLESKTSSWQLFIDFPVAERTAGHLLQVVYLLRLLNALCLFIIGFKFCSRARSPFWPIVICGEGLQGFRDELQTVVRKTLLSAL